MPETNGWSEWGKHVLLELDHAKTERDRLREDLHELRAEMLKSLGKLHSEVAGLKVKSTAWGVLGGAIPAIAAGLWILLKGK